DEEHYVQLRRVLAPEPAGAAAFEARFALMPPAARTGNNHARIHMRDDGACPFLDAERLCDLQRAHGPDVLPHVCAEYPRMMNVVGERAELSGFPSCPEVARLLLFDDAATDVLELEE